MLTLVRPSLLFSAAAPDEVLAYLSAVSSGGRIAVLVTNPFGSHVVEDLLRALSACPLTGLAFTPGLVPLSALRKPA